jgi:cellulose synthase (UDP-forming)
VAWETGRPKPLALSELPQHPSVDVFIATYNEPLPMLRTTVAGALTMRYPGTVNVYLCDDGERETVRALAEDFGVGYLTRTEHSHAKAGNLNNAMALSSGELIVTLDADMVPTAEFLERTVGHFADPTMAFVQAPQAFSNDDPFQYNLFSAAALPNEQDFFMRTLLAGKARFNAVMYVGSNTVFRRTALDEIGGFATGVITEDMATGMLLQSHGWRAEFVPDIVAAGAAPESFEDLLVQRDRWARGNVQTARKWNPLTLPGLSAMQRWLYADGVLYWYFGVFKFVYFLAPICSCCSASRRFARMCSRSW